MLDGDYERYFYRELKRIRIMCVLVICLGVATAVLMTVTHKLNFAPVFMVTSALVCFIMAGRRRRRIKQKNGQG